MFRVQKALSIRRPKRRSERDRGRCCGWKLGARRHSIPPANSPSVITVGGYQDNNELKGEWRGFVSLQLWRYSRWHRQAGDHSARNVGGGANLTGNRLYKRAEALSHLAAAPDYQLSDTWRTNWQRS